MTHRISIIIDKLPSGRYVARHPQRRSEAVGKGDCPLEATVALAVDVAERHDRHRDPTDILPCQTTTATTTRPD